MSRRAPIVDREVGRAFQNENFAIYNQTASINLVGHWKVSTCDRPVRLLFPKRRRSRPFINTEINVITLMLMFTTPILMWTIGCKMPNKQKKNGIIITPTEPTVANFSRIATHACPKIGNTPYHGRSKNSKTTHA